MPYIIDVDDSIFANCIGLWDNGPCISIIAMHKKTIYNILSIDTYSYALGEIGMGKLHDSTWQFMITLVISLISLTFTALSFQNDSLRAGAVIVIFILVLSIVLINLLTRPKTAAQQQKGDTSASTIDISPNLDYPKKPRPSAMNRQPRITRKKLLILIFTLVSIILYIIAIALANNNNTIVDILIVTSSLILMFLWIISLVSTARLGYWRRFILIFVLAYYGIFIYVFFVPNTPHTVSSQPQKFCPKCGAQIRAGAAFCTNCGTSLTHA